jgi:tetratricopeptide (TPR) repeat protein
LRGGEVARDQAGASWQRSTAIFVFALAVRALYLLSIRHAFFFEHLTTEPQRYQQWAAALLDGSARPTPPFDEAPGYLAMLAGIFGLFGRSVLPVAAAQALLDAGTCAMLGTLAGRCGGPRAAWLAGGLAALYGPMIYFTGALVPATVMLFAVSAAMLATPVDTRLTPEAEILEARPPARGRWLLAGFAWSAALLVRSEIVLALPLVFLWAAKCGGRRALARVCAAPLCFLLGSLLLNHSTSGRWVPLTTGGGVNAWLGNNPDADGVNPFVHGPLNQVVSEIEATTRDPIEADRAFLARALEFVRAQPAAAARLVLRKALWTLTDRELPNTSDPDWETAQSWLFRAPGFPLRFGVIAVLAAAGTVLLRQRRLLLWLAAPIAIGLGTSVLFFTNGRFRFALLATLIPLAAIALDELIEGVARLVDPSKRAQLTMSPPAALRLLAPPLVAAAISYSSFDGVRAYRLAQIDTNTGALALGAGDLGDALEHSRRGRDGDPGDKEAWIQLAQVQEKLGQTKEAADTWSAALAKFPREPQLQRFAGRFRRRLRTAALEEPDANLTAPDASSPERSVKPTSPGSYPPRK